MSGARENHAGLPARSHASAKAGKVDFTAFRIDGPALVFFSGGRKSGFMLKRIIDARGGEMDWESDDCNSTDQTRSPRMRCIRMTRSSFSFDR